MFVFLKDFLAILPLTASGDQILGSLSVPSHLITRPSIGGRVPILLGCGSRSGLEEGDSSDAAILFIKISGP